MLTSTLKLPTLSGASTTVGPLQATRALTAKPASTIVAQPLRPRNLERVTLYSSLLVVITGLYHKWKKDEGPAWHPHQLPKSDVLRLSHRYLRNEKFASYQLRFVVLHG